MKRNDVFASKWLSAADLDTPLVATIKAVRNENIGEDEALKPIAFFREPGVKPCVLNQTRWTACEEITGAVDSDQWVGATVCLRRGSTLYKGKRIACVEITAPPARLAAVPVTGTVDPELGV